MTDFTKFKASDLRAARDLISKDIARMIAEDREVERGWLEVAIERRDAITAAIPSKSRVNGR